MSSLLDKLGVWNLILDHLEELPLDTLTENTPYRRWLDRNFDHLRDTLTQMAVFNFTIQYTTITADSTSPAFRWSYRYRTPGDCLHYLPPTRGGYHGGTPIDNEQVGLWIYTDYAGPLDLEWIARTEAMEEWSPLAVAALSYYVAFRMANRFTAKANLRDRIGAAFSQAWRQALTVDARQGTPRPVDQEDILLARQN